MEVTLLNDVKKLGRKRDIVEISDGYGRSFLLNKNLAVVVAKKSVEILDEQNLQHDLGEEQKEADTEGLEKQFAKITPELYVKTGEGGRTFSSISVKQIVVRPHETYGVYVGRGEVISNDAITSLGYTNIKTDLYGNKVIGAIRVHMNGQEAL